MSAALDLNASLTLTDKEIEAIIKAELDRRGHAIEKVSFTAVTTFAGDIETGDTLGTGEVKIMAHITVKL